MKDQIKLLKMAWKIGMIAIVMILMVSLGLFMNISVVSAHDNKPSSSPIASPSQTPSPSPSESPNNKVDCISTDVHGRFDHVVTNPVTGHFYNISTSESCSNKLWVLVYGTNEETSSSSFVSSQKFITSYEVEVARGATDQTKVFNAPSTDFCVLQYDLMDKPAHPEPPYLATRDSIAVKRASCDKTIASPTPTPTPCIDCGGKTIIINNNNEQHQDQHQDQHQEQTGSVAEVKTSIPVKTPETGVGVLGMAGMFSAAPIGVVMSRFGKGRLTGKKEEDINETAMGIVNKKQGKSNA